MQLTAMTIWLFTGLAILTAGVLAALQFLHVRPRQVRVVTNLFWQEAADQARARTLFERFRHPRTYLLLLAAALLALLALAQPVLNSPRQPHRVVVLEAGLDMTAADRRFDKALELVRAEAASVDENRIAVIAADPHPRLLKHFDESMAELKNRLDRLKPADSPVVREDLIRAAKALIECKENGEMVLISAQPVGIGDDKVRVLAAGGVMDNTFILSASFIPDDSDPVRGTFHCRVGHTGKQPGRAAVKFSNADNGLLEEMVELNPGETREFTAPGITADGTVLSASVAGDNSIAGDNFVDFPLPDRRRILVLPVDGATMPPVFTAVLHSLTEVATERVTGASLPEVRVGPPGSDAHIRIHPAASTAGFKAVGASNHPLLDGLVFEDALCRAGSVPMDGEAGTLPLLQADGSTIASLAADARHLDVSANLFDADASAVRRTAYLVFWSRMLHYLAGWTDESVTLSPLRANRSTDPAAAELVLKAGLANFDLAADANATDPAASGGSRLPLWQMLLAGALVLMVVEALLNIREKIS